MSLNEIGDRLGSTRGAYLSPQFKNSTGLTPSLSKKIRKNRRKPLDEIL